MEWQVGQWVTINGKPAKICGTRETMIDYTYEPGSGRVYHLGAYDAAIKPFVWQAGKTYKTTLEGVTATITCEAGESHIRGTAKHLKPDAVLSWAWNNGTGLVNSFADDPDVPHLLPFLADEPSEPEPTLTERFTVGQLGTLWGVFDRLTMKFARFSGKEVAEDAIRVMGKIEDDLTWWEIEDIDLPKSIEESLAAQPKSQYRRTIKGVTIDLYDLAEAYGVTDHAQFHAMKKIIMAGDRGYKDRDQDLQEAIDAIQRAIELGKGGAE